VTPIPEKLLASLADAACQPPKVRAPPHQPTDPAAAFSTLLFDAPAPQPVAVTVVAP
jgi:hypothetical protein